MGKRKKKKGIRVIDIMIITIVIIMAVMGVSKLKKNKVEEVLQINQIKTEENQEKYVKLLEDKTKLNTSEKLKEDKKFEELKVKDIQLTYKDGVTNLLATIENTTQTKIEMQNVEIVLLDEKGKELNKIPGIIEEIEAGKTTQLNCSVTADFSNVYNFEIRKR